MSENMMAANLRFAMVFCEIKKSARGKPTFPSQRYEN